MQVEAAMSAVDTYDVLWPDRARTPSHASVAASYRVGPSSSDPRFLLPVGRRHQASVLHHFRLAGTKASRRRLWLLRATSWLTGGWPITRARLDIRCDNGIESAIAELLGQPVVLGIQLGPRRANRKPLLQVLDASGRPLAVGKLGVDTLTDRLVRAEGAALQRLASTAGSRTFQVPELVANTEWHGAPLVVMSHLPLAGARPPSVEHRVAAMQELAFSGPADEARFSESRACARLSAAIDGMAQGEIRDRARGVLDRLVAGRRPLLHGTWHGDWTAWNCGYVAGQVLVWDWERMETGVPVGWDALHYSLRDDLQRREPSPEVTRDLLARAPALLAPFGVAQEDAPDVAAAYLLQLAVRYGEDGQRQAGGRSARVEEWLLPVLSGASAPR